VLWEERSKTTQLLSRTPGIREATEKEDTTGRKATLRAGGVEEERVEGNDETNEPFFGPIAQFINVMSDCFPDTIRYLPPLSLSLSTPLPSQCTIYKSYLALGLSLSLLLVPGTLVIHAVCPAFASSIHHG
jgi:hypothetical protein